MQTQKITILRGTPSFLKMQDAAKTLKGKLPDPMLDFALVNFMKGCNFRCMQCCNSSGKFKAQNGNELTKEDLLKFVSLCNSLGARTFGTMGEGEPTLYWDALKACIGMAHSFGMHSLIFTNGSLIDAEKAEFFRNRDASLVLNIPSFKEKTYFKLVGKAYTLKRIMENLRTILEVYGNQAMREEGDRRMGRIAINTVINDLNSEEIPTMGKRLKTLLGPVADKVIRVVNVPFMKGRAAENEAVFEGNFRHAWGHSQLIGGATARADKDSKCGYLSRGITVQQSTGNFLPCPYGSEYSGKFGNLRKAKTKEQLLEARIRMDNGLKTEGYCLMRAIQ